LLGPGAGHLSPEEITMKKIIVALFIAWTLACSAEAPLEPLPKGLTGITWTLNGDTVVVFDAAEAPPHVCHSYGGFMPCPVCIKNKQVRAKQDSTYTFNGPYGIQPTAWGTFKIREK
jgi:hypothetical protein